MPADDASAPNWVTQTRLIRNAMVPMRDGVRLATTVYLPPEPGRYPAMFVRTAYNRAGTQPIWQMERGVALVAQDVRGRYGSEGDFEPFVNEHNDGLDTLDWIARQPWSNGKVGMAGDSYLAAVQLCMAGENHPALAALNPRFMASELWRQAYWQNGALSLALTWSWLCMEVASRTSDAYMTPRFDSVRLLGELPLIDLDQQFGDVAPAFQDYLDHDRRDAFWQARCFDDQLRTCRTPVLLTAGWFDYYPAEAFRQYALLCEQADPAVASQHRVVVGPWMHGVNPMTVLGEVDFGPDSLAENEATQRWLATRLQGQDSTAFQAAPIRIFVMGENRWRDEYEWPLARTRWTPCFLHAGADAKPDAANGDGRLAWETPGDQPPDRYSYDPADPVTTWGGNHSIGPWNPGLVDQSPPGPYDQRKIESRPDLLVYTLDASDRELEITGPVRLTLFAASSAVDTDFVARLTDVHPDGRSMLITEGVLRARFRDKQWDQPELMTPGQVYRFEIDLQPTAHVIMPGHRLRLHVTSSSFPLWDRNLNTGAHPAYGRTWVVAEQTIHHDSERPSHLTLPVIDRPG